MEEINLERFPHSESAKRMLDYVSADFYGKSYVGKWLYQVMGQEYDEASRIMEELPYQFFPETATWGLKYHEIKWGLPVRENLSHEARRKLIYQARDFRAPMTPYRMETSVSNVTGYEVRIFDCHDPGEYVFDHPNRFMIALSAEGSIDVAAVHRLVDALKQSHTTYGISDWVIEVVECGKFEKILQQRIVFRVAVKCTYAVAAKQEMRMCIDNKTEGIGASVNTKRNLWYFDGSVRLDGSRILNALDKNEDLEGLS